MVRETQGITFFILCIGPLIGVLGSMLFTPWRERIREIRKQLRAQIRAHEAAAAKLARYRLREWVRVQNHTVMVHQCVDTVRVWGQRKERTILVDVEYKNESEEQNLSCRTNQWSLFDQDGHQYKTNDRLSSSAPELLSTTKMNVQKSSV